MRKIHSTHLQQSDEIYEGEPSLEPHTQMKIDNVLSEKDVHAPSQRNMALVGKIYEFDPPTQRGDSHHVFPGKSDANVESESDDDSDKNVDSKSDANSDKNVDSECEFGGLYAIVKLEEMDDFIN